MRSITFAIVFLPWLGISASAQQSQKLYDTPLAVLGAYDPAFVQVLDLDGDGDLDALGKRRHYQLTELTLGLYLNDGQGVFALGSTWMAATSSASDANPEALGNFDGVGGPDFAIGLGSKVRRYLTSGAGPPLALPDLVPPVPGSVRDIVAADFDLDGLDDIAALVGQHVVIFRTQISLLPDPAPVSVQIGDDAQDLDLAEIDGQAPIDLVVEIDKWAGYSTNGIRLVPVVAGAPSAGAYFQLNASNYMVVAGDIDSDGDDDVLAFSAGGNSYYRLSQLAPGAFQVSGLLFGGPATDLADVDGDGDLDGVCCGGGGGGDDNGNMKPSWFEVALNTGGSFAPAFKIEGLGAEHIAGAADLDGDLDVDLIGGRAIYFAEGPLRTPPELDGFGGKWNGNYLVDLDRDGDPDLMSGPSAGFANDGTGKLAYTTGFAHVQGAPAPLGFYAQIPADLDGDGDLDSLGVYFDQATSSWRRVWFRNLGGGYSQWGGEVAAPGQWTPFEDERVADIDADGDVDLLISNDAPFGSSPLTPFTEIWTNDGTPHLTLSASLSDALKGLLDIDGDGLDDLVSMGWGGPGQASFGYHLNAGGGSFGPAVNFAGLPSGSGGSFSPLLDRIALADFDADADVDIAFVLAGKDPYFLLNQGGGSFGLVAGALPSFPISMWDLDDGSRAWAADVDLDGHADLMFERADQAENTLTVYRWSGPGLAFAPGVSHVASPRWQADFDGDGDGDLLGKSFGFRNLRYHGPSAGSRTQSGAGVAGAEGWIPTLGESGPLRPGELVTKRATGGLGASAAFLVFALAGADLVDFPFAGMHTYVNVFHPSTVFASMPVAGAPGQAGAGTFELPFVAPAFIAGWTFYDQAIFVDPASPNGLISATGQLALRFGY